MPITIMSESLDDRNLLSKLGVAYENEGQHRNNSFSFLLEGNGRPNSLYPTAKFIANAFDDPDGVVVTLDLLRVWPSGLDTYLIESVFAALTGRSEVPPDGTVAVFERSNARELCTLAHCALLFGWEVSFFAPGGGLQVEISHHGRLAVFCGDQLDKLVRDFESTVGTRPEIHSLRRGSQ